MTHSMNVIYVNNNSCCCRHSNTLYRIKMTIIYTVFFNRWLLQIDHLAAASIFPALFLYLLI